MSMKDKQEKVITTQEVVSDDELSETLDSNLKFQVLQRCGHGNVHDMDQIPPDVEYIASKVQEMKVDDAILILKDALVEHDGDMNFPKDAYDNIENLVENQPSKEDDEQWKFECKLEAALIYHHSPYPEVRAVTDPFDDENIPVETFRAYFLGFLWTIIGTGVNEFFAHRLPSIVLTSSVIQLLLYPCGKAFELLPNWKLIGKHTLNPGPWSFKEQMLSTVIFNVAIGGIYVSYNIYVQKLAVYYNNQWVNFGYQFLLALSTQFLGFGFAGILRKFVIYPSRCVWPTVLPALAMNRALLKPEKKETINGWSISRYRFFFICFAGMFCYFWLPNYLFEALSYFNWMNWISPDNFNLATVSGSLYGLGLNPIPTFDWNIIDFNFALTIPFYSQCNQIIGSFIAFFAILGVYYTNYKWTAYIPINTNSLYTNTGERFAVTEVLTNNLLDMDKYRNYSPPFYSAANLVVYGAFFAIYPFSFIYTCFTEWKGMVYSWTLVYRSVKNWRKSNFEGFKDPHSRMMSKYKEVPDWYFLVILLISIVLSILCIKLYPTQTPVWGIFFAIGINFVFLIPLTLIVAVTGFQFGLNVLVELIVGYALPGNGLALMIIKAFGYNIDGQAQTYIFDQKLAHYAKVPPMAIFRGQIVATFLQVLVSLGVINWSMSNVEGICEPGQPQRFVCPSENTFYSASVLWGVIGPKKVFNGLYPILQYCFLIGALLPIPCILAKKYLKLRYFEPTLIIGGMLIFAPYNLTYYLPSFYFSFIFMYYIRKRYQQWWEKYNYVLTSALGAGVAFSSIIIFFAVQYNAKVVDWWGNSVSYQGVEGGLGRQSLLNASEIPQGFFGPSVYP